MSGGSNKCLQAENAGPITYWNKKNGSELIDPKYILIYSTKWSVHSKFN